MNLPFRLHAPDCHPMKRLLTALPLLLLLALPAVAATAGASATLAPFTATYNVLRNGSTIGESTLSLKRGQDGHWRYRSTIRGTHGLAALFGADMNALSVLRVNNGQPESLYYDYRFDAMFKHKRQQLHVDWKNGRVRNEVDGDHTYDYATEPGMVESHSIPLALLAALRDGHGEIDLPVAVKDRVEHQQFRVNGPVQVTVPAGRFKAMRVSRVGDEKAFTAWYDTRRFETPVKLSQHSGGDLTLVLTSYRKN